ncbi:Gfo/Idh/MocA family oxidoreductase [Roseimaritima ulvae]|uniref:Dehydrogenase n=1 Tax=Roseimaritima ulvae TaxID=980254 RepID=A0A5B9QUD4_9BACT|nr:Gfo/Idh/MocA family oxidoreductase [Roseimaritima ulvae]QEG41552.1 Dehydrogenase [Roseimaritima ulvae]
MTQRIAVIGAGHLGKIHARLLGQVEDAVLAGIADPTPAARQAVEETFDVPVVADYQDLIADIDAAVIASPTGYHAEIASTLLKAGKHVFVEKPLATSPEDAYALVQLAQQHRRTLQVGHVERFNPAWSAGHDVLRNPKYIEAVRASRFPGRCLDVGVVMDLMIHDIDLVLSLTAAPLADVQASGMALVSNHEDLAEARLTFECGLVANLKASRVSPTPARQMQAYTENGFVEIDFGAPTVTMIRPEQQLLDRSFSLADQTSNPLGFADELFSEWLDVQAPVVEPRNAILDELYDFVISIRSAVAPTVSGYAGARAVEVATAVLDAIELRQWSAGPGQHGPHATPAQGIEAASRQFRQQRRAA